MTEDPVDIASLLTRIESQEKEIESLKVQLSRQIGLRADPEVAATPASNDVPESSPCGYPLHLDEYQRYGRQMILPMIGISGQLALRNAAVLIVGLGGLGCPAASYLAGAGVGTLGLMDGDSVDLSNLHRQILHSTERIGMLKVESAAISLRQLNPLVRYRLHRQNLEPRMAVNVFRQYDLVLDCTDHPMSRYLVSDAAVCAGIPFVSAAALRTDGQLYVLNVPSFQADPGATAPPSGPCYRCVHPIPPPPSALISCGEGGILGPVVGVMGVLMATEALKLLSRPDYKQQSIEHTMLLYSAYSDQPFRQVKLRGRRTMCIACSPDSTVRTITAEALGAGDVDYASFCGRTSAIDLLPTTARLEAPELAEILRQGSLSTDATHRVAWSQVASSLRGPVLLLDVRLPVEFDICRLSNSINVPLAQVRRQAGMIVARAEATKAGAVVAVCRFGNDSQLAVEILQETLRTTMPECWVGDLRGGLASWRSRVDNTFPEY